MSYYSSVRFETTYVRANGHLMSEPRLVDSRTVILDPQERNCLNVVYCESIETTAGKVARVVLWTSTGALIGAPAGGVGAGIGGVIGLGIGICTIL